MRIWQWHAEAFKRIKLVDITPNPGINRITGDNGAGKSANLDGIAWLFGGDALAPTAPVHNGEKRAELMVKIGDDEVKYIVKRTYNADSGRSVLTVSTPEGAKFGGPQGFIDALVNIHAFDPLGYMRMKPKEQVDALLRMLGLSAPLDEINAANKTDFTARTDLNRRIKELKAQLDASPVGEPVQAVDVADVMRQIAEAEKDNQRVTQAVANELARQGDIQRRVDLADGLRKKAAALIAEAENYERGIEIDLAVAPPAYGAVHDIEPLRQRILDAQVVNAEVERQKRRKQLEETLVDVQSEADMLTANIDARTASKALLLKDAKMPLPELSIGEECVLYKGVPLKDGASEAEQAEVSAAIAMEMNPTLKVIFLRGASLMSATTRERVFNFALARGYQVFSEEVDVSGKIGFYMVDGEVAAIDGMPVEESAEPA